jgi:hypothetical protein
MRKLEKYPSVPRPTQRPIPPTSGAAFKSAGANSSLDIRHLLLVLRTISKTDRVEASRFVKASGMLIRLEAPQFECADPAALCCID